MTDRENPGREKREAEAAKAKEKEGAGTVPNVTPGEAGGETEELKEAMHELEEEKGDWAKDH
jgi:hypothetical protein